MPNSFSYISAQQAFQDIESQNFDLLVIGGGITGAGIALDASLRGLKVCLIEKEDYAFGTSSRSTKLIHGGLRYLKQMEFKLVHDVGTERRIVYENARNLVRPEQMLLPITTTGSLSKTLTSIALAVYDFLGGVHAKERKKMLNRAQTIALEPLIKKEDLLSGALYYEYRTDDARLCMANIVSAVREGATCFNYVEAIDFLYDESNKINGAKVKHIFTNQIAQIHAKVVVNASGPWVDSLRKIDHSLKGKKLQLTKGVHIVFPYAKLAINRAIYFDTDDHRMIFCIPRQNTTYVGTTDTVYDESIENPTCSAKDVDYLLRQINNRFENVQLTKADIVSSWSGLRPLIYEEGKSASELSRKDEIFESESGLFSMAGGKLTGYRLMAEHLVDKVCKQLQIEKKCSTRNYTLNGCLFKDENEINNFIEQKWGECKQLQISDDIIRNWVYRYGRACDDIIEILFSIYQQEYAKKDLPYIAELLYTIQFEQVATLSDFLIRRSGMLYFERELITEELMKNLQQVLLKEVPLDKSIQKFKIAYQEAVEFH